MISKNKIKIITLALFVFLLTAPPLAAQAQGIVNCGTRRAGYKDGKLVDPCTFADFFELIYMGVNTLISMAGLVAVFFIVWGGAQMLMSAGNMERVQQAKRTVWNAVLGLIVVLMSYLIVSFVVGLILPGASGNPLRSIINFINP